MPMTELREKAYSRVAELSPDEQDMIASIILDTLDDGERWAQQCAQSQGVLARLAAEAELEYEKGESRSG